MIISGFLSGCIRGHSFLLHFAIMAFMINKAYSLCPDKIAKPKGVSNIGGREGWTPGSREKGNDKEEKCHIFWRFGGKAGFFVG
jgi:hypothetical protein